MRGKFIVFEGIDGSGKSSVCERVSHILNLKGFPTANTAQPSQGVIGKQIRSMLKNPNRSYAPDVLAAMFVADRADHWHHYIKPKLNEGFNVLCDRYIYSSLCYQTLSSDPVWVQAMNDHFTKPDMVVLLDLPVNVALSRLEARGPREQFEEEETQKVVRKMYLDYAQEPHFRVVDADGVFSSVVDACLNEVMVIL